jgi:hypothetical protein
MAAAGLLPPAMRAKAHNSVACLVVGLVFCSASLPVMAASPVILSGSVLGVVTNARGVPQMGAAVLLFNRQDRLLQRVLTGEKGAFAFESLAPDIYSIRVNLASFAPVMRNNILVQPGMRSLLNVSLAGLFSSIQLVYPTPEQRAIMNDDWKWVLRTASATRPVLRLLPGVKVSDPSQPHTHSVSAFSDTRGLVKVSAGDGRVTSFGTEADLGTAFALATSLFGNHQLQVSGNLGYGSQSGVPTAAFRTSYSRGVGAGNPEVSVTMRQLFAPSRMGAALVESSGIASMPALRTMSLSFDDHAQLSDSVMFQYGFSLDSVSFLDRLNYFSPYARLTYALGDASKFEFTYTSGNARPDLSGDRGAELELQRDLNSLALFPRVSVRDARARVQRGEDFELGYARKVGSRTFRISGYNESVSNAGLTMLAPAGLYSSGDILPDLFSTTSVFNAGNYQSMGYTAAVTQNVGEHLSATVMFGSVGALTADHRELVSEDPDELRSMIHAGRRHAVTARAVATSPWSGTHLIASYQWTDRWTATPGHLYSTQSTRPEAGLNLYIRQPIPTFSVLPWRMEASADLRNLLAQGYIPLSFADGRRLLLVQTPRSFRGGLSFIF